MAAALAFLSCTHPDDEYFGGYIAAFGRMLESAVHVVSGDRSFRVFRDADGLVIGENWQKRLDEVIDASSLFVPMLSPLYFSSAPCRAELEQFLRHERDLKRDDLILPVYLQVSPKLEKPQETARDPLAAEIARRQRFDWRAQVDQPIQDPATRRAMLNRAAEVDKAAQRLAAPAVPPAVRSAVSTSDTRLDTSIGADLQRPALAPLRVLWVDDSPDNNRWERRGLESYGLHFTLARDTDAAQALWQEQGPFAAVVSDMGRPGDAEAGFTLLAALRAKGVAAPYFIYTTAGNALRLAARAAREGARGITGDPDTLVAQVVAALR